MKAMLMIGIFFIFANALPGLSGFGVSTIGSLDTVNPILTLSSPNGGEIWYIGETKEIIWIASDTNFDGSCISLWSSFDGGSNYSSFAQLPNMGFFFWDLPAQESNMARVMVQATDTYGNLSFACSEANFSISLSPPLSPTNVQVDISNGVDAVISWNPVTHTVAGSPITPDGYLIFYNEAPYTGEHYYYYLWDVSSGNSFTHVGVARRRDQMFYHVVAYKDLA